MQAGNRKGHQKEDKQMSKDILDYANRVYMRKMFYEEIDLRIREKESYVYKPDRTGVFSHRQ